MSYWHEFDAAILEFIQRVFRSSLMDHSMLFITRLGDLGFAWIMLAVVLLCCARYRRTALLMLCALLITHITGTLWLKNLFERPRPFVSFPTIESLLGAIGEFSFPSGHASSSFTAAAVLLYRENGGLPLGALFLAIGIAFSRLYLGVHYPSDVLCGALLGTVVAFIICESNHLLFPGRLSGAKRGR